MPERGDGAGDRRRGARARALYEHEPATQRCASSATWTTPSWPRLRAGAAIALVPSRSAETFGLAAAEAMAAGLPVAASRVGALPELLDEQGLVAAGDAGALARRSADWPATGPPANAGSSEFAPCAHRRWWRRRWLRSTTRRDVKPGRASLEPVSSCRPAPILNSCNHPPTGPDHGHHRPGRIVPGGAAAGAGLSRHRLVRGAPERSLGCSEHLREQVELDTWRPARSELAAGGDRGGPSH